MSHINVDTYVDSQLILMDWEGVTDAERLALIEVYGALNEMAREMGDSLPTEMARPSDELSEVLERAINVR